MPGGEREFVRWLQQRAGAPRRPVLLGIGDDMAVVEVGGDPAQANSRPNAGAAVLLTSDLLLDGVHFQSEVHTWERIGRKAIACSLSDCAAMAVRPVAALVSVAWPTGSHVQNLHRLYEGMWSVADEFGCAIVGGDTTSWSHPLAIDVGMLAAPYPEHPPIRRSGARPGDTLYVTGPLGGSFLGKHLDFTPRVREAHELAVSLGADLHAMMDLSDGLAIDLHRLCESSGVSALLVEGLLEQVVSNDARRVAESNASSSPDSPGLSRPAGQAGLSPMQHALNDGEDFELLLAVAGDSAQPQSLADVLLYPVGSVTVDGAGATEGAGENQPLISIRHRDGRTEPLPPGGYEHSL